VDEVLVEHRDGAAIITINRPHARNAVNRAVTDAAAAAIDELEARPDLIVGIITGAGGFFSAGMDLKAFLAGEIVALEDRGMLGFTKRPPKKPLIAAVEGPALAGGCEIALACDLIVAERGAQFGLPEVTRGLIANGGGVLRLASALPRARALELILTGRRLGAAEAAELGLITQVVDDGQAVGTALSLAAAIAAHPPDAVQESLYLANAAARAPSAELWTLCTEIAGRLRDSSAAVEGATAFLDRRAANWNQQ
jgi:enoyl-CoA hydratase